MISQGADSNIISSQFLSIHLESQSSEVSYYIVAMYMGRYSRDCRLDRVKFKNLANCFIKSLFYPKRDLIFVQVCPMLLISNLKREL